MAKTPPRKRVALANTSLDNRGKNLVSMVKNAPKMGGNIIGNTMKTIGQARLAAAAPPSAINPAKKGFGLNINMDKAKAAIGMAAGKVESLAPFYSNIANALRKPPMPIKPTVNSSASLSGMNLSNERNDIRRATTAANRATERNVDGNTAEAIKLFNKGNEYHQLSGVNARENEYNIGVRNQQAMIDYQTATGNNANMDDYNQSLVERDIARQRESSANLANAGDKMVLIGNEKRKASVERDKVQVLSGLFSNSGVLTRNNSIRANWKKMGLKDPLQMGEDGYSDLEPEKKANGGRMKRMIKMA